MQVLRRIYIWLTGVFSFFPILGMQFLEFTEIKTFLSLPQLVIFTKKASVMSSVAGRGYPNGKNRWFKIVWLFFSSLIIE
jgi:hypothetical protein